MDGRIIKNRAATSMKLFSLPLFSLPLFSLFIRRSYAEDAIGNENKNNQPRMKSLTISRQATATVPLIT